MMAIWLNIPLGARVVIVFLLASVAARFINWAIFAWAHQPRPHNPWLPLPDGAPRRRPVHRLPIVGWWLRRRESPYYGDWFWVRPLWIELVLAIGLATLYWYEMQHGLLPLGALPPDPRVLHAQFVSHAILIGFMTVATFIDLDEKTIPDAVTIPGTCAGLILAALWPESSLPAWRVGAVPIQTEPLWVTTPLAWPRWLDGFGGLAIALSSLAAWALALMPKTLWWRGGPSRFVRYLVASMVRRTHSWIVAGTAALLAVAAVVVWWTDGDRWQALLTSSIGLAAAGAMIWGVRVVASWVLEQEAMGFGDVTLMAMIGTFIGWQGALFVFFLAPFAGIVVAVAQWIFTGRKEIAYGPYLCLATVALICGWPAIWERWGIPVFWLGWWVPALFVTCVALLGMMLLVWRRCTMLG